MTEELAYEVVQAYEGFELRRYPAYVVAEVVVGDDFEEAGSAAFRTLFGYISGQNRSGTKAGMTSPVLQSAATREARTLIHRPPTAPHGARPARPARP